MVSTFRWYAKNYCVWQLLGMELVKLKTKKRQPAIILTKRDFTLPHQGYIWVFLGGSSKNVFIVANWYFLWWPTTVTAKPKTSRQKQMLHSKNKLALVLPCVDAFAVRYLDFAVKYLFLPWGFWFCREVFGLDVRFSVLPWGILFLPWGFWFCRDSCGPP